MYASLGNIIFQTLVSFDALSDQRETIYSQLALINGKPTLQRTGEALIEFSMGISFHVAFCNPEDEYYKLNNARVNAEVLPFIYGNGFNEGDYVITKIDRVINQTDKIGNFVEISCNVTLLEYANGITAAKQLEQDKKNAFALSSNRPLPAKTSIQTDNPALAACTGVKDVQVAGTAMDSATNTVNSKVQAISSGIIDQAQKFMNQMGTYIDKINLQVTKANSSLSQVNNLILAYASITNESPALPAKISAVQTALTNINSQLTVLGALPTTISSTLNATTALSELTNTLNVIKVLKDKNGELTDAATGIAKALATKRVMT